MPIYEFFCDECEQGYEEQKKVDDFESNCPLCNKKSRKVMSAVSFNVKGSTNKSIDSVIGENAAQRWQQIEEDKKKRNKQQYGIVGDKEIKEKDGQRIAKVLNKQQDAYKVIDQAKKEAGITKRDELRHAFNGGSNDKL